MKRYLTIGTMVPLMMIASELQVGDVLHGFAVKSIVELPDVQGRLVRMSYEKNGADLAWLDRDDDNKTFAIGFRTFPSDDTGVAHIIEHSVLCGSEKYPVKEPFVDLLKSSFQTFLNAWTSADSTMYPVCSRDDKDFRNLIDVYMDAVFHPLSARNPMAFRQEGWHYELDTADGELTRNGVVYSEMKGAFANPERLMHHEMNRLLYPDTCYRFVSGGDPAAIPTLTFEAYQAFYRKFYHPSNARIFLDGRVRLAAVLEQLDGFLKDYGRATLETDFAYQKPVSAAKTIPYELGPGEDPEGKVLVCDAWVFGRYDEREKLMAMDILSDALADSNEAPLKKALVGKGLCEDVGFGVSSSAQLTATVFAKNVKRENVDEVRRTVRETLARLAGGLDRTRLAALIDNAEFRDREKGSPSMPCGLQLFCEAYDVWLYGGDPAEAFRNGARFASLRRKLAAGWFEELLRTCIVENPHHGALTMVPSTTLAAANQAAERAELAAVKKGWSAEQINRTIAEARALKAHQEAPDRPEDRAKLPTLAIGDVPLRGPELKVETVVEDGVTVYRPHTTANGVVHLQLYFAMDDLTDAELADAALLATVLGDLATENLGVQALHNALDATLGRFSTDTAVFANPGERDRARPRFRVGVSALDAKKDEIVRLVPEVLLRTSFADAKAVGDMLRQKRLGLERAMAGLGGRIYARLRAEAQLSVASAISDRQAGIGQLRHLQAADRDGAMGGAALCDRLAALARRIFTKDRLTICLSDNVPAAWTRPLSAAFPRGACGPAVARRPLPRQAVGFVTSGRVASAAQAATAADCVYSGPAVVAARILTLDYLWNEIRVKGGAYGGNFGLRVSGVATWLSWNDPQPDRSFGVYGACAEALRAFVRSDASLDCHVISGVAALEPYRTAWDQTLEAGTLLLGGRTPEDLQRLRADMLHTTKADLAAFADRLDGLSKDVVTCVVGGAATVDACSNRLDRVESVVRPANE
ncbi:MAG: insulinase family protein [Kiritimatiellia bacterium]